MDKETINARIAHDGAGWFWEIKMSLHSEARSHERFKFASEAIVALAEFQRGIEAARLREARAS